MAVRPNPGRSAAARAVLLASAFAASTALPCVAAAPDVNQIFPPGGGRGQTVEVTVTGSLSRWPIPAWVDEPGIRFEAGKEKGKFTVHVAADAPAGLRLVRFFDEEGASAPRPFVVGTVPEVLESEPNNELEKAQDIAKLPALVNGRLGRRGDVDAFAVSLKQGDRLIAAVEAAGRLGAPLDAVLQVVSNNGLVIDQNDDAPTLDPLLSFQAPADGRYVVRIFGFPSTPDQAIAFAGGDALIYRLTLTTGGFLDRALPSAVGASQAGFVEALGWNIPSEARHPRVTRLGPDRARVWHPLLAGDLELPVVETPSLVEAGSAESADPQTVPIPGMLSGRIEREKEADRYRLTARKGQALKVRVVAREIGSPLDATLHVEDAQGKVLFDQDDAGGRNGSRDPSASLTAAADGPIFVTIRDVNGFGGPRFHYRLDVTGPSASWDLSVKEDRFTAAPGKPAKIAVNVNRQGGFVDPIAIELVGFPDGVTAAPVVSEPKGNSAKSATLAIEASDTAKAFSGPVAIVGRSGERENAARATLSGLPNPIETFWLTVVPKH